MRRSRDAPKRRGMAKMPADYRWNAEAGLTIGRLKGSVAPEEVRDALIAAMASGDYPAGADRITIVPNETRLHLLDLDGLRRIQAIIEAHERAAADEPNYRSVFVCSDRLKHPIFDLYRMVWRTRGFQSVRYRILADTRSAFAWLGRDPEAAERL